MGNIMDLIVPFSLADVQVKGRIIKLDKVLEKAISNHNYPNSIIEIIAEMLMVASLMGSQFKTAVILTIELQDREFGQHVIVDYQSPGCVRSYTKYNENYQNICNNALLIITIDQKISHRYQGIVEIEKGSIQHSIQKYFQQSEQIETALLLQVAKIITTHNHSSWCSGGIIIQKVTESSQSAWDEAKLFLKTLSTDEIVNPALPINQLLYSLYNEMKIVVYETIEIDYKCRCSKEKIKNVLYSLGQEEALNSVINDLLTVKCEFCNTDYHFTKDDICNLFALKDQS